MFKSRMLDNVKLARYTPAVWLAILIGIGFVYGGSILAFIGLLPIGFIIGLSIGMTNQADAGPAVQEIISHYGIFFQLATFFFMALAVYLWVRFVEKRPFSSLGFFRENWLKDLGKGFLLGILQFSLVLALLLLTGTGSLELAHISLEALLFILALIPLWILQGGTEELITRGWLFPTASAKSSIIIGVLVSSALFGALHLFNPGVTILSILNIILYGVFACFAVLKYDNMWILAGLHGSWNFVQGNVYGIQVSGQDATASIFNYSSQSSMDWLSGGAFGAEGSILTSLVLLASIAYLYWSMKKAGKLPQALTFGK